MRRNIKPPSVRPEVAILQPWALQQTFSKPTFKPTGEERALVEQMSSVGIPQESICLVIRDGIDDKTLRK
ncbi:MAG: hypothetical protein VCB07_01040, partial [Gammaproteobacteria bacterium]